MSLHQSDLQRLAKLLGMIGSTSDGEALSAARKAHALISEKGATWFDAFGIAETVAAIPAHCHLARDLLGHKRHLTPFERKFLKGIMSHPKLSEKQAETLAGIQRKVEVSAGMG